jgi:cell division protein FtsB
MLFSCDDAISFLYFRRKTGTRSLGKRFMATRTAKTHVPDRTPRRSGRILGAFFCFVVCVMVVDALVGDQGLIATMRARKQYNQLAADLGRIRAENAGLREEARRLRQDPAAIEELARRELGLMSPGEKLFIIKDVADPSNK